VEAAGGPQERLLSGVGGLVGVEEAAAEGLDIAPMLLEQAADGRLPLVRLPFPASPLAS